MCASKLIPRPVERPWGGNCLHDLCGADCTGRSIGEAWIHDGTVTPRIILKWIDAREHLSVQNHPNRPGGSKREAWYILQPPDDGRIITGMKEPLDGPDPASRLEYTSVSAGQVLEMPSGRVHALTAGSIVYEIQEPLDVTYRIYDWGRPRETHIDDARRSINSEPAILHTPSRRPGRNPIIARKEFTLELWAGPCAIEAPSAGVLSHVDGPHRGGSWLVEHHGILILARGEVALWASRKDEALHPA